MINELNVQIDNVHRLFLVGQKHEAAVSGAGNKDILCKEKEPFEKQLYKFMREKKTPIKRLPSLGFKEGWCHQ